MAALGPGSADEQGRERRGDEEMADEAQNATLWPWTVPAAEPPDCPAPAGWLRSQAAVAEVAMVFISAVPVAPPSCWKVL